eukprot:5306076-Amphidinium_carterae.1
MIKHNLGNKEKQGKNTRNFFPNQGKRGLAGILLGVPETSNGESRGEQPVGQAAMQKSCVTHNTLMRSKLPSRIQALGVENHSHYSSISSIFHRTVRTSAGDLTRGSVSRLSRSCRPTKRQKW